MIRRFLWWAYMKESQRWRESNSEERIIVSRHFTHGRMMVGFSLATSFFFYAAFLRGIYNFRNREILNMRRVPLTAKLAIAGGLGVIVARDIHFNSIYEPNVYKLAVKYRPLYDSSFAEETAVEQTAKI